MELSEIIENPHDFYSGKFERASTNVKDLVDYFEKSIDEKEFAKFTISAGMAFEAMSRAESGDDVMRASFAIAYILRRYKTTVIALCDSPELEFEFV